MLRKSIASTLVLSFCLTAAPAFAQDKDKQQKKAEKAAEAAKIKAEPPVFWEDAGDISSKDLFGGPGGRDGAPKAPYKYDGEDFGQTSPKFDVTDANGVKWRAKLGVESESEPAASRIMWALGFAANTNYFVEEMQLPEIKARQKRGNQMISADGRMTHLRLQRHTEGMKKVGDWNWKDSRFKGRRDFNALRVMMALLSNWDMKNDNNAIFEQKDHPGQAFYGVSDMGATFGKAHRGVNGDTSKNNIPEYEKHKFVDKVTKDYVDFAFPDAPNFRFFVLFEWQFYFAQWNNHWIGRHIPIEDVRWTAKLVSQLSPQQIRDAFRAGGYSPDNVERYSRALEARIAELKKI